MLHPACRVASLAGNVVVVQRPGLTVRLAVSRGLWQERRGWYSPSYGIRQDCVLLVVELAPGVARNTVTIAWRSEVEEQ
jgi:hypothetical protein